jgi:hypothetical protein
MLSTIYVPSKEEKITCTKYIYTYILVRQGNET